MIDTQARLTSCGEKMLRDMVPKGVEVLVELPKTRAGRLTILRGGAVKDCDERGLSDSPRGLSSVPLTESSGNHIISESDSMKKTSITVTEAARNFADCVNRAHYQNVTFVLLKNGEPFARLVPDSEKVCVGRDLAEALAKLDLPENEAKAWHRDLQAARKTLKIPPDKWR
jgi:antitoxin (DNA-binding transcriptional repressor) of toxin-antitoxin stability system